MRVFSYFQDYFFFMQEMGGGNPWSWIYEWSFVKRNKALVEGLTTRTKLMSVDKRYIFYKLTRAIDPELDKVCQREEIDLPTKLSHRRLIFNIFFLVCRRNANRCKLTDCCKLTINRFYRRNLVLKLKILIS